MGESGLARLDRPLAEVSPVRFDDLPGVPTTDSVWDTIGVSPSVGNTAVLVVEGAVCVRAEDGSEVATTGVVEDTVRVHAEGGSEVASSPSPLYPSPTSPL